MKGLKAKNHKEKSNMKERQWELGSRLTAKVQAFFYKLQMKGNGGGGQISIIRPDL